MLSPLSFSLLFTHPLHYTTFPSPSLPRSCLSSSFPLFFLTPNCHVPLYSSSLSLPPLMPTFNPFLSSSFLLPVPHILRTLLASGPIRWVVANETERAYITLLCFRSGFLPSSLGCCMLVYEICLSSACHLH